jgi:hypothetical protein
MQREVARYYKPGKVVSRNGFEQSSEGGAMRFKGEHLACRTHPLRGEHRVDADVGADIVKHVAGLNLGFDPLAGSGFLDEHFHATREFSVTLAAEPIAELSIKNLDLPYGSLPQAEQPFIEFTQKVAFRPRPSAAIAVNGLIAKQVPEMGEHAKRILAAGGSPGGGDPRGFQRLKMKL